MHTASPTWIGRVVGAHYEVLAPLRTESLATVFSGRDERDGRPVEIKVLSERAADRERMERFTREITASFLVAHENTLEVLASGEHDGVHFLVLEAVAGQLLSDVLAAGPLPYDRAAAIALQVVRALGAAHQEGVVHRALSPEKILVCDGVSTSPEGGYTELVKVCDFGLAKLVAGPGSRDPRGPVGASEVTANEVRLGDAAYMAPEYISAGRYSGKSDLYAVGALLYRMVAGRPPFTGDRALQLTQHVRAKAPPLVFGTPPWLTSLVADLLQKDSALRPGVPTVVRCLEEGLRLRPGALPVSGFTASGTLSGLRRISPPAAPPAGSLSHTILARLWVLLLIGLVAVALVSAGAIVAAVRTLP